MKQRAVVNLARAAIAVAVVALAQPAQAGWTQLSPSTRPTARRSTGMVTEVLSDRDRLWIYGGFDGSMQLSNQLWYYDTVAANWVQASTAARRERHMLGFVPRCHMVVIFGGNTSVLMPSLINDLRTYDTLAGTWQTYTASGTWPSARTDAAFQYSAEIDRLVMFGGMLGNLSSYVNELWELDLGVDCQTPTWIDRSSQQANPPSGRAAMCSAYVPSLQRLIVFGGEYNQAAVNGTFHLDVVSHSWTTDTAAGDPAKRSWMPCALDTAHNVVVLHGGFDATHLNGTYLHAPETSTWSQFTGIPVQGVISDHATSYSPHLGGTLQFGGQVATSSYVDTTWLLTLPTPDAGVPDAWQPDTWAPDTWAPDTWAPDTWAPDTWAPDTWAPDTWAPDTWAPDTWAPDTWAPDTWAPDVSHADSGAIDADACVPSASDDLVCDGIDSDCDGVFDEDAIASDVCAALASSACELAKCDPLVGHCVVDWLTGCCADDGDCASPTVCVVGSCDLNARTCGYRFPENCCADDSQCDDGNACTSDRCDTRSGACGLQPIALCCNSDADCGDGDDCSLDHCSDRQRCLYQPAGCAAGPCGTDPLCLYSGLYLGRGAHDPAGSVIDSSAPVPVWQLAWESAAIGGRLTALRVWFDGFAGTDQLGPRVQLALYLDTDGDGAIDAGSQPLAVGAPTAIGSGSSRIDGINLALPPAATGQLLVTAALVEFPVTGCAALARTSPASMLTLALLGLLALRWRRRSTVPDRRAGERTLLLLGFALALVASSACLRSGYAELRRGSFELRQADDIVVEVNANERLWVQPLPQRSTAIQVLR